jgi:hypothetical protein
LKIEIALAVRKLFSSSKKAKKDNITNNFYTTMILIEVFQIVLIIILLVDSMMLIWAVFYIYKGTLPFELRLILLLLISDLGWSVFQLVFMSSYDVPILQMICTVIVDTSVNVSVTLSALIAGVSRNQSLNPNYKVS